MTSSLGHSARPLAPFGVYLHVPFCARRCGYCDFNTYTPGELAGSMTAGSYRDAVSREIAQACAALGPQRSPADTVFIGGGTPTMLPADLLTEVLGEIRARFGVRPDAEVTVEANPDTLTPALVQTLADIGVTRVSVGMQSAVPSVLAVLERTHRPDNVAAGVGLLQAAGLSVSLDLIYGTPGETLGQWRQSLTAAVALRPEHLSAYALTVEPGTRLGALVRRGRLPEPDGDDQAAKYELADEVLAAAGYRWYEVSNWAREPDRTQQQAWTGGRPHHCRHNLGYWRGANWWGLGPGAHSHVDAVRWWNLRHPGRYARALAAGESPAEGREVLTEDQQYDEQVLLGIRLADGLALSGLRAQAHSALPALVDDGLVTVGEQRIRLTRRGRLLADLVVRRLLGW